MVKKKKKKSLKKLKVKKLDKEPKRKISKEARRSILIVFLFVLGLVIILSLFNSAGIVGKYINSALSFSFGWTKFLVPIYIILFSFVLYKGIERKLPWQIYFGSILFGLSFNGFLHFILGQHNFLTAVEQGIGGGYLGFQISSFLYKFLGVWAGFIVLISLLLISIILLFNVSLSEVFAKVPIPIKLKRQKQQDPDLQYSEDLEDELEDVEDVVEEEQGFESMEIEDKDDEESINEDEQDSLAGLDEGDIDDFEQNKKELDINSSIPKVDYNPEKIKLPLKLLKKQSVKPTSNDLRASKLRIKRTFENFGLEVEMGEAKVGPTVTQYTLKPPPGVKLSRITALRDNLSLALAAHPIRIEAPIPGKSLVGIEVPNKSIAKVCLREVLESSEFKKRKSNLMIALGKDVSGKAWVVDISKMPHLLVAGATGSGKSVCLNSIIVSLLYQNTPDTLRFIMVDPKKVELPIYNGIPHLLTPVVTDVKKTVNALKWAIGEMDRRYEILAQERKRNIADFNKKSQEPMPYIVIVIDELADLMVMAASEIETCIIRLTQMARAVGIHLIIATQRPSVDVITGLIKANIPARIAFSVASLMDSRTILDTSGAESLIGKGDMLFLTPELGKPRRIQGSYISDEEIKRVVLYLKNALELPVEYNEEITEKSKNGSASLYGLEDDEEVDELFEDAKQVVIKAGKASASLLQRRLRVGYARAARLIDLLEEAGIVGPAQGAKPREILVQDQDFQDNEDEV